LNETLPVPPPVDPKPLRLTTVNSPPIELPEPIAVEINVQPPRLTSYDAIVEWVTGGGIPEAEDYDQAVRIWMSAETQYQLGAIKDAQITC
jgi:hypothetical protein